MIGLKESPWVIHYDASSCNGCDIEVLACLTPGFDVERFGIINTGNPKHADIFLVTGAVNEQNKEVVKNIYEQMPEPKVVVAVGICATSGGIFRECYNVYGGVDTVIPVDVYVPGCAVRPESIIDGVVRGLSVLESKKGLMMSQPHNVNQVAFAKADKTDLEGMLAVQKSAFQSEAEIYGDDSLPTLKQTFSEIEADFARMTFLKGTWNGKIVSAVRAFQEGETAQIHRLVVHPYFQSRGVGKRMMEDIEKEFPGARRFEVNVGHKSQRTLAFYEKLGYREFKREPVAGIEHIFMEKTRA